jgi:serine/threonine protein kinase
MTKECPPHQILNEETNRCVNRDGKIGKAILAARKSPVHKSPVRKSRKVFKGRKAPVIDKKCPPHQILNEETNRCVNRDGKIGKAILEARKSPVRKSPVHKSPVRKSPVHKSTVINGKIVTPVGKGISSKTLNIVEDCAKLTEWDMKELLGEGQYGKAFKVCKGVDDCNYVLKMQKLDEDFYIEIQALTELKDTGVVPKYYSAWTCDGYGYFVIEKLDKCPKEKFNYYNKDSAKELDDVLEKIYKKGWLHVDVHPGNIMCKNGKFIMIDFGWAVKKGQKSYPKHPLSQRKGRALTFECLELAQNLNKAMLFSRDNINNINNITNEFIKCVDTCKLLTYHTS